eukprot:scaffold156_cov308-Prasinococcus_capsulatus_cf.AAC.3
MASVRSLSPVLRCESAVVVVVAAHRALQRVGVEDASLNGTIVLDADGGLAQRLEVAGGDVELREVARAQRLQATRLLAVCLAKLVALLRHALLHHVAQVGVRAHLPDSRTCGSVNRAEAAAVEWP